VPNTCASKPQYTTAQRAYYIAIVKALGNWGRMPRWAIAAAPGRRSSG
jgi:hypothetical protein